MTLSIDWVCDQVHSYFIAHGVNAPVEYGTEKDSIRKTTLSRVVIGLQTGPGSIKLIPAGPAGAPGRQQITPETSSKSIATKRQGLWIAIRGEADPTVVVDRVRASQTVASDLLDDVLRAIHKIAHSSTSLNVDATGEWVDVDKSDFAAGAMIVIKGTIDIPVFEHRPRFALAKPSAPNVDAVHVGLDLEACDASHCEPVVSTP